MNPASFLAAIRDEPDDDVSRLVFADWLEDHGDGDRAEFIRAQCELARGVPDRGRSLELLERTRSLLREHRARWLGRLEEIAPGSIFERGFVDRIRIRPRLFVHVDLALHPICHVRLERVYYVRLEYLLESGLLPPLRTLDFQDERLGDKGVTLLARWVHLGRLRFLNLSGTGCGILGLESLFASERAGGLESLALGHNALGNAGLAILLRRGLPPGLRQLDLSYTGIDAAGAARLAEGDALRGLRSLRLEGNPIGQLAVERLAESPHMQDLELLDVRSCGVDEGAAAVLRREYGARLVV